VSSVASEANGTQEGLSTSSLNAMIDEILDADQFMTRGRAFDILTMGRDFTRPNKDTEALYLEAPITQLLQLDPNYRTSELQSYLSRVQYAGTNDTASLTNTAVGNRDFWTSDYMVQQRNAYMLSVKTVSTRTDTPESINGENLLGNYEYSGSNLLYVTGNEYNNIEPTWDWYRFPGTTSERSSTGMGGTYSLQPSSKAGPTTFSGGASDGNIGAVGYRMNQYNITADKSYFLFNSGEVAMGAGITQTTPQASGDVVGTNINQTLLNGTVYYSTAAGSSISLGSGQTVSPSNLRWVNHADVGYFFLTPVNNATIRTISQSGNWYEINNAYSNATVSDNVFSLDLNHGAKPNAASYLYAVIPGQTPAQMDSYLASNPFNVLSNTTTVQAVTDNVNNDTEATFYSPGSITLASGLKIAQTTTGQGASVLWEQSGSTYSMFVASPTAYAGSLSFTIGSDLVGAGASWNSATGLTTVNLALPAGSYAGSTVSETLGTPGLLYFTGASDNVFSNANDYVATSTGTVSAGMSPGFATDLIFSGSGSTDNASNFNVSVSGAQYANSLTFTGTGTPAASTPISIAGTGSISIAGNSVNFAAGTGIVVPGLSHLPC
jgi:chondroitin AC lyase